MQRRLPDEDCSESRTRLWMLPVLPEWVFLYGSWGVLLPCSCFSTSATHKHITHTVEAINILSKIPTNLFIACLQNSLNYNRQYENKRTGICGFIHYNEVKFRHTFRSPDSHSLQIIPLLLVSQQSAHQGFQLLAMISRLYWTVSKVKAVFRQVLNAHGIAYC